MGGVDALFQIAQRTGIGRHQMHIDAKMRAEHPARIGNATITIKCEPNWHGVQDGPAWLNCMITARLQHPGDITLSDGMPGKRNRGG